MSEIYRDDLHDIGHGTDALWLGVYHNIEDRGYGHDRLQYFERGDLADIGYGRDELVELLRFNVEDHGYGSDELSGAATLRTFLVDRGRGRDQIIGKLKLFVEDAGSGRDELAISVRHNLVDLGRGSDELQGQRYGVGRLSDQGRGRDILVRIQRDFLEDVGQGRDEVLQRMRSRGFLADAGHGSDEFFAKLHASSILRLVDHGRGDDEILQHVHARDFIAEDGTGWDEIQQSGDFGQAWTANVDTWAMSRYAPFTALGVAVVDGVAHLLTADGVYALDGAGEQMHAWLSSGKMDLTGRTLAIPIESHLEYELSGATNEAGVEVTTTHDGVAPQSWLYPVDRKKADTLTNTRARFGRGLRGRHFAYTLRLTGERAYINDWSVLAAPSKRTL